MTKFQQQYVIPFFIFLSILGAIYIWIVINQQTAIIKNAINLKGLSISKSIADSAAIDIILLDPELLHNTAKKTIKDDEDVNGYGFYSAMDDTVISNIPDFTFPDKTSKIPHQFELEDYTLLVKPMLKVNNELIGLVGIRISKKRINVIRNQFGLRLGVVGIIAFLSMGYFVYYLTQKINLLAEKEAQKAQQIEVAYLQLQGLQTELQKTNEHLENRVVERSKALKSTNQELNNANVELKDFTYIVSHDLKAPIRALGSLTGWIIEDYEDVFDEVGNEQLQLLKKRVERMHRLIDGILQYSRIGRIDTDKESVDLTELIPQVWQALNPSAAFSLEIVGALPTLMVNQNRVTQIFTHLFKNTLQFGDKPQTIVKVSWQDGTDYHHFQVSDNGRGIPAKETDKVFKIFYTTYKLEDTEHVGLGLTLAKRIIELYDGAIEVESYPKQGTTFTFSLAKSEVVG